MNRNVTALAIMSLLLIGMFSPLLIEDGDAETDKGYYVVLSGTNAPAEPVKATIANGGTETWKLSVINETDGYLDVSYSYSSTSADVTISNLPVSALLGYRGGPISNVDSNDITIIIEKLSDSYDSVIVDLAITITHVESQSSSVVDIVFDLKVESAYDMSSHYNKFFGIFPNTLPEPFNTAWMPAIVSMVVMTLLFGFVGSYVISFILRRITKTKKEDSKFTRGIMLLMVPLTLLVSVNMGLQILDADTVIVSKVSDLSMVLAIVLVTCILWKIYVFLVKSVLGNFERNNANSAIDSSLVPLFKMIGRIIFWVGGVSAILGCFGVDLQGILVSAGVVSLGITLGAQNVLSQFFSGLVLLMTRPFRAGDYLKINDKVYIVRKVKLMYTEFNNWAGDEIITMPNNVVSSASISNMTKGDKICRQYVFFSVAYGTDLKKAAEVMKAAAKKSPLVIEDAKHEGPAVRVTNFLSSGVELRLAIHTPTFDDTSAAAGEVRGLVYEAFAENGIEIPYDRIQIDVLSDRTERTK